jgi:hypothetical protein
MRRLNWGTIATLTVAFAAGAAIAFWYSVRDDARNRAIASGPAFPEDIPFDFADKSTRSAFAEYAQFYDGLPRIADSCDRGSGELYRVAVEAVMTRDMEYDAIDIVATGDRASVEVRSPLTKTKSRAWRLASSRVVGWSEIERLREAAARLLASNIPATFGDRALDSSEWTIEMCRRGRYHFWQRHSPDADARANAPFIAFTDAVKALQRKADARP